LIKKADIFIIISVLAVILIIFSVTFLNKSVSNGDCLNIYVNGELTHSYQLPVYEKKEVEINSEYGYNKIIIDASSACVLASDCSGNDCVSMGAIKDSGDFIICAPHRLIIRIENKKTEAFDAVTY